MNKNLFKNLFYAIRRIFIRNDKVSEWNAHVEIQKNWGKLQEIPFSERNNSINNLIHEINIEFDITKNVKLQNINYQNVFLPKHRDIFFIYENIKKKFFFNLISILIKKYL